ncbi:MAG TPA: flagellar hook-length control protein FliK [Leptospiraceae bacterium]|nr:flagellar hook-length control protein FliK [Leptospiraceae bacterium]HMW06735.1 flagellar hook-length control protein FliK [Leptospiraceae bacterium]HMX33522.1 flagellar hook-length control protein FliK [Leptospiraceae bacterium]HMY32041.1 flagellar hook-length control protein FliK [Leptospiraceae bacterium]HNA07396.1 flagellar hook-length control protein FliK [Leptospiraceae bacterium]
MQILNSIENFFFGKVHTVEVKETINTETNSNFHEMLHQAVNDASKVEQAPLNLYTSVSEKEISNDTAIKSFAMEAPVYKTREEKNLADLKIQETNPKQVEEPFSSNVSYLTSLNTSKEESNFLEDNTNLEMVEEDFKKLESKEQSVETEKSAFSDKLLESFVKSEVKSNVKIEKVSVEQVQDKIEKQSNDLLALENKIVEVSPKKTTQVEDPKKNDSVKNSIPAEMELSHLKAKDIKVSIDTKEMISEKSLSPKIQEKPANGISEDVKNLKVTKNNEAFSNPNKTASIKNESNLELNQINNSLSIKEEVSVFTNTIENKKSKKNFEIDTKEKLNQDNKVASKEAVTIEKDMRPIREGMVDVLSLDRNKWTITRKERELETQLSDRKKDSVLIANEMAIKSSSSQSSSDSDKSFSNPKYETNGLKTFSETLKAANSDKPKEALFDRENFSKSLNDLVTKARINIVENGKNSAQISLYPKELGKMTLNIDVVQERVEGRILVDSEMVKNRLLGDVSQLKAELKANGLELQNISIEVRNESTQAFEFANASSDKDSSRENGSSSSNGSLSQNQTEEMEVELGYTRRSNNLVDIKV